MEKDYSVKIAYSKNDLSARDRIKLKDISDAIQLDEVCAEPIIIDVDNYVVLEVHNEKSDNKDYRKIVVIDKGGQKYVTGSDSFLRSLEDIVDEMTDAGEDDIQIKCYKKDSKNYKGKQFITCSIV